MASLSFLFSPMAAAGRGRHGGGGGGAATSPTTGSTVASNTVNMVVKKTRLSLAGRLRPMIHLFRVSPEQVQQMWTNLCDAIDLVDIFLLIIFCFFTIPIGRLIYNVFERDFKKKTAELLSVVEKENERIPSPPPESCETYEKSLTYNLAVLVQQIARLAALVYVMDCLLVVLQVLGVDLHPESDPTGDFFRLLFYTWSAFKLVHLKRYMLAVVVNRTPTQLGKAVLCDRILDVVIYLSLILSIMDTIKYEVGPGLASLFAFGGMGTFVLGLACKDIVAQIVSGIILTTMEKFYVGEDVELGDGTRGIVENIGWLYTDLRKFDNIVINIPNTQLTHQRISNYSRILKCRVQVKLRVSFRDYKKIPNFCTQVLIALRKECDHLITEGRPFRANWRNCNDDHLQIIVDTHHNLRPSGTAYFENKEHVYYIIYRVAEECGIQVVEPFYNVRTTMETMTATS